MVAVNWKKGLEMAANPGPRLVTAVQVALVLMLAYSLAQISWRFLPAMKGGEAPAGDGAAMATTPQVAVNAGLQIPQWHLFGEATAELPVAAPEEMPETTLQLTLRGVIASPSPALARAIIADPAGKEDFFRIGDTLPGNVALREIHGDRVVIQSGARYETLTLPKDSLPLAGPKPTSDKAGGGNSSYTLREYRNALLNNPKEVADLVRITPRSEGGRFLGYQLQPGRDPQFMARYGLMPGDVLVAVNGVMLDNQTKGMQVMKDLAKADTLDLEIDRNGVRQRFTLPVN